LTDLILKKPHPNTSKGERIQSWKKLEEIESKQFALEEEPAKVLTKDKSPKAIIRPQKRQRRPSKRQVEPQKRR
jgi:hypothetical protein